MVIKYSQDGEAQWAQGIGGEDSDDIYSIAECRDGGYIVGGSFRSSSIYLGKEVSLTNQHNDDGMVIKFEKAELPFHHHCVD